MTATRKIADRLRHMLQAIDALLRISARKPLDAYRAEPDLAAAVERYLERLSEASRHIPDDLKGRHPHIDWRGVADIGNALRQFTSDYNTLEIRFAKMRMSWGA